LDPYFTTKGRGGEKGTVSLFIKLALKYHKAIFSFHPRREGDRKGRGKKKEF